MKVKSGPMSVDQIVYTVVLGSCSIAALAQEFTNWVAYFVLCLALAALLWHRLKT